MGWVTTSTVLVIYFPMLLWHRDKIIDYFNHHYERIHALNTPEDNASWLKVGTHRKLKEAHLSNCLLQNKKGVLIAWILSVNLTHAVTVGAHNLFHPLHPGYISCHFYNEDAFSNTTQNVVLAVSVVWVTVFGLVVSLGATLTDLVPVMVSMGLWQGFKAVNNNLWEIAIQRQGYDGNKESAKVEGDLEHVDEVARVNAGEQK